MNIFKIALSSSILGILAFALFSITNLIGFAANQGMVDVSKGILKTIASNYSSITLWSLVALILSAIGTYLGFFHFGSKKKYILLKIASPLILIGTLVMILSLISPFVSFVSSLGIQIKYAKTIFAITQVLFGIVLILKKELRNSVILALGPLYIFQGLVLFASHFTQVQIFDFTIAIKVIEASFFTFASKHKE